MNCDQKFKCHVKFYWVTQHKVRNQPQYYSNPPDIVLVPFWSQKIVVQTKPIPRNNIFLSYLISSYVSFWPGFNQWQNTVKKETVFFSIITIITEILLLYFIIIHLSMEWEKCLINFSTVDSISLPTSCRLFSSWSLPIWLINSSHLHLSIRGNTIALKGAIKLMTVIKDHPSIICTADISNGTQVILGRSHFLTPPLSWECK